MSLFRAVADTFRNQSPVSYTANRSPFWRSMGNADRTGQLEAMDATPAMFAIASSLAADVARVEWKLYRKKTDQRRIFRTEGAESRQEVMDHMALRVWNKPNPFMTRQEYVETVQMHYELTGEQWWTVGYGAIGGVSLSFPSELWPVRPDRMDPVPDPQEFLTGYVYSSPDGTKVPLDLNQVAFLRRPHPMDPYRGISPVSAIAWDLDADNAAAQYNRNFFRNSAEPGGIITVPKKLSDRDFADLKMRWNEQHRGVANAHRVAILAGENFSYQDRHVTQSDMQFVELRNVSTEQVRMAYRYPKPMLGTVEDVNRANADAAEVVYARWLMVDRLERIKQALNFDFLPLFGSAADSVEFDYESPVPEDKEADNAELTAKVQAYQTLVNAGADPQGVLEFLGLPDNLYKEPEPMPAPLLQPAQQPQEGPGGQQMPPGQMNGFHRPIRRETTRA
jgi:HK97 family phage portal protein